MKITQIRSATNRLVYAGKTFLIDPWLAPRHVFSFIDIPGRKDPDFRISPSFLRKEFR